MKKLYLIVLVFQLLILCSCSKPLPQGASVQGQDILEAANLEAEKSTVGLDSNEPDLSVSESVIPERTEQQADAVNQSVPSDEEIVDATADCETALAEENNGNAPEVPAVTETEMRLHQAVMQVYTGQPEVDNDALAAIAHYLEVHPSVGELYLPFDDFGISIYALDGIGNSQYVLFRKKAFTVFYMQYLQHSNSGWNPCAHKKRRTVFRRYCAARRSYTRLNANMKSFLQQQHRQQVRRS